MLSVARRPWFRSCTKLAATDAGRIVTFRLRSYCKWRVKPRQPSLHQQCAGVTPTGHFPNTAWASTEAQTPSEDKDRHFMQLALQQAQTAAQQLEVPVGAVLVLDGTVVAAAHNQTEATGNPVAHAEMTCIQQAALKLGRWKLLQSTLYVTLEPCPMCAGALLQSRLGAVVYGAKNTLLGADGSWVSLLRHTPHDQSEPARPQKPHPFHPSLQVRHGVMAKECGKLMQDFFRKRRLASPTH